MKKDVRIKLRSQLNELTNSDKEQWSKSTINNLFDSTLMNNRCNIAFYYSKNYEVYTEEPIKTLLNNKKNIFLPKIVLNDLHFAQITNYSEVTLGAFDIFEPLNEKFVPSTYLDTIIVPCLAIDICGNRIGRGGGFYDRFLMQNQHLLTICLAYEKQIIKKIYPEDHDFPIAYTITEKRIINHNIERKKYYAAKIIAGSIFAHNIIQNYKKFIQKNSIYAKLVVILVGNDAASTLYVNIKKKYCAQVGILFELIAFNETINETSVIRTIKKLNIDPSITGILIQLPLPKHFDSKNIIDSIFWTKDVDGLTTINRKRLSFGDETLACCTPKGIIKLLEYYKISLKKKYITLVGYGFLVGQPLSAMLKNRNITFTICDKQTPNDVFWAEIQSADILICATGKPHLISAKHIKPGAIVIDAGTAKLGDKIAGDVFFHNVLHKVELITPVPGGIGPMTIAMLIENIIQSYLLQHQRSPQKELNAWQYHSPL